MDSAGGLCHCCTMGLPPDNLFYLYIPVGCLDSSLLLQTELQEVVIRSLRSTYKAASVILFSENKLNVRTR